MRAGCVRGLLPGTKRTTVAVHRSVHRGFPRPRHRIIAVTLTLADAFTVREGGGGYSNDPLNRSITRFTELRGGRAGRVVIRTPRAWKIPPIVSRISHCSVCISASSRGACSFRSKRARFAIDAPGPRKLCRSTIFSVSPTSLSMTESRIR